MTKQTLGIGLAGLLAGAIIILGLRFVTYHPGHVHYHANFAVYLNGKREQFKDPSYYEEIEGGSCSAEKMSPAERAHMHDNVNDLVHVHDHAVTWGDLFNNLHWAITRNTIVTHDQVYTADSTNHITYMINGQAYDDVSTEVIKDQDRLLIDFGDTSDTTLKKEMDSVAKTAHHYDIAKDPAACQGDKSPTVQERLKHLL